MQSKCKQCGNEFTHTNPRKIFCTIQCRIKHFNANPRRKVRTVICHGCGVEFTGRIMANRKYCSHECYMAHQAPISPANGRNVCCVWCGKEFYLAKNQIDSGKKHFCCVEHHNEWQGRNKTAHTCIICGTDFKMSPSFKKYRNTKYCSIQCRDKDPEQRQKLIELNLIQQSGKKTSLEKAGYTLLDELGISHLAQHLINGKFCVDAFVPEFNTVIQFDGDYWHGNPQKFPNPDKRQKRRMTMDMSQDAYMAACGYTMIRIWESDMRNSIQSVRDRLINHFSQP